MEKIKVGIWRVAGSSVLQIKTLLSSQSVFFQGQSKGSLVDGL